MTPPQCQFSFLHTQLWGSQGMPEHTWFILVFMLKSTELTPAHGFIKLQCWPVLPRIKNKLIPAFSSLLSRVLEEANTMETQSLHVKREASALWKLPSQRDEQAWHVQVMEAGLEMSTTVTLRNHSSWHVSIVSQRESSLMFNQLILSPIAIASWSCGDSQEQQRGFLPPIHRERGLTHPTWKHQ